MKQNRKGRTRAWVALCASLCFTACDKRENKVADYFPQIEWVEARLNDDASVTLRARILSTGADNVLKGGFCADTVPDPSLTKNQYLADYSGAGQMEVTYFHLRPGAVYYFRAFVGNNYGYAATEARPVKVSSPDFEAFDCHPELGKLKIQSGVDSSAFSLIQPALTARDSWRVQASSGSSGGSFIYIAFQSNSKIQEGLYSATTALDYNASEVSINISSPFWGYGQKQVTDGRLVVRQVDSSHFRFALCGGKVNSSDLVTFAFVTEWER